MTFQEEIEKLPTFTKQPMLPEWIEKKKVLALAENYMILQKKPMQKKLDEWKQERKKLKKTGRRRGLLVGEVTRLTVLDALIFVLETAGFRQ